MRDSTLIRKNLFRKKLRFLFLFLSIFVAFFLYGTLVTVKNAMLSGTGDVATNRLIVSNKINFTQPLPISYLESVRATEGVAAAAPTLWFGGYYREPRNFVVSYATDLPSYLTVYSEMTLPPAQREACLAQRTGLLVGKTLAAQYGWKVGQNVTLLSSIWQSTDGGRAWPFTVCGIYTDTSGNGGDAAALMHYEYFNGTRTIGKDDISLISLTMRDGADAERIGDAIDTRFANSSHETDTVSEQQFAAAFAAQFGDIGLIVTLVVGAAFASMLMIVGSTMLLAVRERTRELAILKTIGFPVPRLLKMVIGESLLIAALGGIAGLLVAQLVTWAVSQNGSLAAFAMRPATWGSGLLWILVLGLTVAAVPAYRALNLNVLTALGRR
jgi:putative ABC transport system permease protein